MHGVAHPSLHLDGVLAEVSVCNGMERRVALAMDLYVWESNLADIWLPIAGMLLSPILGSG